MRILHVVGARPNFMKIAPVMRALACHGGEFEQRLVHTGQHYDESMSRVFFEELELPRPDLDLAVGSGTHAWQTGQVMMRFEPVVVEYRPDWVMVPGDVNSTLACALVASKLGIRVAHLEAGLRSFDRGMPEEINRVLTDQISDLLLTPSAEANENLLREGVGAGKIRLVGNVMIDTLVRLLGSAEGRWPELSGRFGVEPQGYVLVTLHRPSNVDEAGQLRELVHGFEQLAGEMPVLFAVHPRTRQRLAAQGYAAGPGVRLVEPLGYLDFLALQTRAALVVTDSGGIQEETTYLGIPCLTLRANTERPVTITQGTNRLVRGGGEAVVAAAREVLGCGRGARAARRPPYWDGRAAERVVEALRDSQ